MSVIEPTMLITTSEWNKKVTFRLIPLSDECPYTEGVYDPDDKVFVLMSKHKKNSLHFIPRVDENGDPITTKKPRPGNKLVKEQRIQIETFMEYYLTEPSEIHELVKYTAVNPEHTLFNDMIVMTNKGEVAKKKKN